MSRSFKYVCLGGGNSAGYFAKELVTSGLQPGELAIITEEPVSNHESAASTCSQMLIPTEDAAIRKHETAAIRKHETAVNRLDTVFDAWGKE
jgi:hypothetical protein